MRFGGAGVLHAVSQSRKRQQKLDAEQKKKKKLEYEMKNLADPNDIHQSQNNNVSQENQNNQANGEQEENAYDNDDAIDIGNIDLKERTEQRIIFRKLPWPLWIVGTAILVTSIYLLYTLILGSFGVLDKKKKEWHWWQYVIVIALLILAFSFLLAGKVESVIFDKQKGQLQLWATTVICRKQVRFYPLGEISGVKAYKRGHNGVNIYTLHYNLMIEFQNGPSVKIVETQSRDKVIKQMCLIRNFLGFYCHEEDLEVIDESTRI